MAQPFVPLTANTQDGEDLLLHIHGVDVETIRVHIEAAELVVEVILRAASPHCDEGLLRVRCGRSYHIIVHMARYPTDEYAPCFYEVIHG